MKDKTITLTIEELKFIIRLLDLKSVDTLMKLHLQAAESLKDLEEMLEDLCKEMRSAVSSSEELIGRERVTEISKALLVAYEDMLGIE